MNPVSAGTKLQANQAIEKELQSSITQFFILKIIDIKIQNENNL